jgi:DNA-binding LacI/PurR family transcriptional regulator
LLALTNWLLEDFFQPRITSVVQPTYEIGHRAVEVLFERIVHGVGANVSKMRLPGTLVVRDSSRLRTGSHPRCG